MYIITREQVKLYLGLTGNDDYNDQIDAYLPIIDSKVKLICNNNFNDQYYCDTDNTKYMGIHEFDGESLEAGQQVFGDNIEEGTTIVNIYSGRDCYSFNGVSYCTPFVELSKAATGSETSQDVFFGISSAYLPTIAKGLWWLIGGQNTKAVKNSIKSKSLPPLSISYNDKDSEIDGKSGMPAWFLKGLPKYMSAI